MSNNVTPAANESGEVQAAQIQQVLCDYGSHNGQLIAMEDAVQAFSTKSDMVIVHREDTAMYQIIDDIAYAFCALVAITRGSKRGQFSAKWDAIELYNDLYIHKCDEDHVQETDFTGRKFVYEDCERENIILLCEDTDEENDEWEYKSQCTKVWTSDSFFYDHDSRLAQYVFSGETGRYYYNADAAAERGIVYDRENDEYITQSLYDARYNDDGFSDHHNTASYHYYTRRTRKDDKHCGFSIGFEVEKEDREVKVQVNHNALYDDYGWCKETDGSLDTKSGFEAVSPVYSLFGRQLEIDLKNQDLRDILNATYSTDTCGGHINISSDTFTKEELYEGISAFFPLLYCIYENRIHQQYCQAKKKNEMSAKKDKYSAIYIRDNRVEIRIFPAVKSVENLIWRRDLVRIMVKNINATELQVFKMLMNKKSKLYRHLLKVMSAEKIHQKCVKFLEYSKAFNDKNIDGHGNNLLNK